jgi:glycosyltransferase involved in cell wall biosynthesis
MAGLRCSVIVPVYNEGANIAAYCRRALETFPQGFELLVVHDMDEDDTLPALAALPASAKPVATRTVRNAIGRGVRNAIVAGMQAASAPVIIVSMADLSDDLEKLDEMATRAERGAAVVCASRYMKGGAQHGGPFMKGLMSRVAGVTLHWFAGLPTHDPTNSFKAYRKDFLEQTPIESTVGFCLALELTVKAHAAGLRVEEIPAEWWDRAAGESRFRVVAWLPHYLKWYFWAMGRRFAGGRGR